MSTSDLNSLPVPPEFISALAENATQTALTYLEKTQAPKELIQLVENIHNFGYYLEVCYRDPQSLTGDPRHRLGIEEMVIEAVNAIAKLGGEFQAPSGSTIARESVSTETVR